MSAPVDETMLLQRSIDVADQVLFPAAQQVDRAQLVPLGHLETLAAAGLFDLHGSVPGIRRILATIAGGCGATFFVWAQHHGVVRTLQTSDNTELSERWLGPLRAGSSIAGIAFAHLRRQGPPAIRATETADGWEFTGIAPWATSWGLAEIFAVAAVTDDRRVVWALLPGVAHEATFRATTLELPVLNATGTVALHLDEHHVSDADVLAIQDLTEWQTSDRRHAAQGQTGILGVADRAIRELSLIGHHERVAATAAERLRRRLDERWNIDDEFSSDPPASEAAISGASDHRAECLRVGQAATTALLAAVGGRGMDLSHPAQRLAREAAFYVIQAQTGDGREAVLRSAT